MKKILLWGGALLLPYLLYSQIPFQQGWPVEANGPVITSVYMADLDDDCEKEMIYGDYSFLGQSDYWLFVKNADGTDFPGWPINGAGCANAPVFVDLDNDGTLEIIKVCGGLKAWRYDGTLIWEFPNPSGITLAFSSIDDLDNDGIKEIVVTCYSGGAVFVFEPDGTVRPGWPVFLPPCCAGWSSPGIQHSASIGDIDDDGMKEILFGTIQGQFYCLKPDGSQCPGFPFIEVSHNQFPAKPILYDVADDKHIETFVGCANNQFYCFKDDGSFCPNYPFADAPADFSIGDLLNDGQMKSIVPMGQLYVRDLITGDFLPGWPLTAPIGWAFGAKANPIIDFEEDGSKEIIAPAVTQSFVSDGKIWAYHPDATVVNSFPTDLLFHRAPTPCAVNDLDGDGDIEICCGSRNYENGTPTTSTVFCWDIDHPYNLDNIDWAMDGFDLGHTGRWRKLYHIDKINSTLSVEGCASSPCTLVADGGLRQVTVTATRQADGTHPTGQDVRFSRTLGCGEYSGPVIDNGDGTYTRLLQAPTSDCTTDIHAWVNEFKLQDGVVVTFATCTADLGDVNLNTFISSLDASLVLQNVVGLTPFDDFEVCRADVNGNGRVTSLDAAYILMCVVGNCPDLPNVNFQNSCQNHGNCL